MRGLRPRMDHLQGIKCLCGQHRPPDKDLPGFRSHVRYSVFKDRVCVARPTATHRPPLAWREADGELSLDFCCCQQGCVSRRALFLQQRQYRLAAHACQLHLEGGAAGARCALSHNDLSACAGSDFRVLDVRDLTRSKRSRGPIHRLQALDDAADREW